MPYIKMRKSMITTDSITVRVKPAKRMVHRVWINVCYFKINRFPCYMLAFFCSIDFIIVRRASCSANDVDRLPPNGADDLKFINQLLIMNELSAAPTFKPLINFRVEVFR